MNEKKELNWYQKTKRMTKIIIGYLILGVVMYKKRVFGTDKCVLCIDTLGTRVISEVLYTHSEYCHAHHSVKI